MTVVLPTVSTFVRGRLKTSRRVLLGQRSQPETVVFNSSKSHLKIDDSQKEKALDRAVNRLWALRQPKLSISKRILKNALSLVMALSLFITAGIFGPKLYFQAFPSETVPVQTDSTGTPLGGSFEHSPEANGSTYMPPIDETLPEGEWLIIPRIGVRTQPQRTATSDEATDTGVWMVPDFGVAGDRTMPVILAAHRYGWQWWWQTDYWKYHSFYNLPELEPGDTVELISGKRKWVYEVYAGEEGTEITDYTADMILYTCKYLSSPIRHFRYARLIDPTKNTQE